MASNEKIVNQRCPLSRAIQEDCSVEYLRNYLWSSFYHYLSACESQGQGVRLEKGHFPWMLNACAFTGCVDTLSFLLHTFIRENIVSDDLQDIGFLSTKISHLINQRSPCDFPLPDTWIHQCVRLALTPLHLACWRLDFPMIRTLLSLGADPNALALEHIKSSGHRYYKQPQRNPSVAESMILNKSRLNIPPNTEEETEDDDSGDSDSDSSDNHLRAASSGNSTNNSPHSKNGNANSQSNGEFCVYSDNSFGIKLKEIKEQKVSEADSDPDAKPSIKTSDLQRDTGVITVVDSERFHSNNGLSPLHFAVLGVRCPPIHSVALALTSRVIHDVEENYIGNMACCAGFDASCRDPKCAFCHCLIPPECDHKIDKLTSKDYVDVKEELMEKCLELLISAGANPNQGNAKCLAFLFPLDITIQPPIQIYYGPTMGRSSQIAVNIRRDNLTANLPYITSACRVLVSYNAHFSTSFMSLYKWKPQHLDCFVVNYSRHAIELIKLLMQLGLFSDDLIFFSSIFGHSGNSSQTDSNEERLNNNLIMRKNIETFIAGVVNNQTPQEFVSIVFQHTSIPTIHMFLKVASSIIEKSEFELSYLSDLVQNVTKGQMRTLAHSSMLVILKASRCKYHSISTLPLPNLLKRRLLLMDL